jgi:hypothetical protein
MLEIYSYIVEIISNIFIIVFAIEALIKICGNGAKYFFDTWNRFDFFLVVVTLFGVIFGNL